MFSGPQMILTQMSKHTEAFKKVAEEVFGIDTTRTSVAETPDSPFHTAYEVHLDTEVARQLRDIATRNKTTMTALLLEGAQLVSDKYNAPEII